MSSVFSVLAGGAFFLNKPEEGDVCKGPSVGGNYVIDEDGKCVLDYCDVGYVVSGGGCLVDLGDSGADAGDTGAESGNENGSGNGEFVYEFIVNEQPEHTNKYNIHITDIEADGLRVTTEQIKIHQEPEWAKCNSKEGEYECEDDLYGLNDPEPVNPVNFKDLSWSAWKEGQAEVGTLLMTITMPYKVDSFNIDYFRPKYVPGWIIKENGVEVLKTNKGRNESTPQPAVVEYAIP